MADTIVTVNIHAKTANTDNGWVPAPVAKQSPVLNYDADLDTTLSLLNFPNVFIYDAGTGQSINKSNLQTYYPEYNPGGGGGGGGTTNYSDLTNKPKINNVTLQGNKSLSDIGATSADEVYKKSEVDTALDNKVTKETGKGLSTNDFTNDALTKLSGIEPDAEANVQSDWNQTDMDSDDFIKNKPTLAAVATSGDYNDLGNKPTIPDAQVNSDWNSESGVSQILNKPTLGTAASKGVDSTPTASSTNLVTSGGVAAALEEKVNTVDFVWEFMSLRDVTSSLVDRGAKNVFPYGDLIGITTDFRDKPLVLPKGAYKLIFHESITSGSFAVRIKDASGNSIFYVTESNANTDHAYDVELSVDSATITIYSSVPNDFTNIMICTAEDYAISPDFIPYAKSNYELTQSVEPIPMLVDAGKKNLIKLDFPTKQAGNVTGSMTADGNGIVINGERTQTTDTILIYDILTNAASSTDTRYTLPVGKYVVKASGSNYAKVQVYCHDGNNLSQLANSIHDVEFEYTSELKQQYPYINVRIWISNRSNFNNVTIYPMLCTAADYKASSEFVPYAPSNRELYMLSPRTISIRHNFTTSDYEEIPECSVTVPPNKMVLIVASLKWNNSEPRGIKMSTGSISQPDKIFGIAESEENYGGITAHGLITNTSTNDMTVRIYAKSNSAAGNDVNIVYWIL